MAAPQVASFPPDLQLRAGSVIRFAAIDATTGANVAGVAVQDAMIQMANLTGGPDTDLLVGEWQLVPGSNA